MPYFVYLLECEDGSLYTGITTNPKRRIFEHNSGIGAKSIVRGKRPVKLVYLEVCLGQVVAAKREREIKGWSRQKKLALIGTIRRGFTQGVKKGLPCSFR